jgi:hypothetical protein
MGLAVRAVMPWLLAAVFVRMLAGQVLMKITKLSRTSRGLREASSRVSKTIAFVDSMCRYDLAAVRRCRRCIAELVAARQREVALFGVGDLATLLRLHAWAAGIQVVAVYDTVDPDEPQFESFFGLPVQPAAAARLCDHRIVVAALVGVDDTLEVLHAAGVRVDNIILIP